MRRFGFALLFTGVLVLPMACGSSSTPAGTGKAGSGGKDGGAGAGGGTAGTGGGTAGTAGGTAGADAAAGTGAAGNPDAAADATEAGDGGPTGPVARGAYLVKSVLGCSGCHTPQLAGGGGADNTKFLSGIDCFAKDTSAGCLGSANLTNDATGIKNLTDQQVIDAFTAGIFPETTDGGTHYLFANMPYYQFANVSTTDATAIVAYLRTLTPIAHAALANTGTFATRLTAPQWTPVPLAAFPSPGAPDGGTDAGADAAGASTDAGAGAAPTAASLANGKYLAALVCSTCHTANTSATAPLQLDATKAFQGGKEFTTSLTVPIDGGTDAGADGGDAGADAATTMTISKKIQSANLTPDLSGLSGWTTAQIVAAIKTDKDDHGRNLCSPMRALPNLTDADATDIANYLKAIPAVQNTLTELCE